MVILTICVCHPHLNFEGLEFLHFGPRHSAHAGRGNPPPPPPPPPPPLSGIEDETLAIRYVNYQSKP